MDGSESARRFPKSHRLSRDEVMKGGGLHKDHCDQHTGHAGDVEGPHRSRSPIENPTSRVENLLVSRLR